VTGDRWIRTPGALWRRTTTAVVALAPGAPEPLALHGAATYLWDLLEEPTSLDEAVDLLARATASDEDQVREAVTSTLEQLATTGVVDRTRQ
jgi:hypothetical protein